VTSRDVEALRFPQTSPAAWTWESSAGLALRLTGGKVSGPRENATPRA
jgi:hypothetical protein